MRLNVSRYQEKNITNPISPYQTLSHRLWLEEHGRLPQTPDRPDRVDDDTTTGTVDAGNKDGTTPAVTASANKGKPVVAGEEEIPDTWKNPLATTDRQVDTQFPVEL